MRRDPAAVRPVFRKLAWILGPYLIAVGVIGPAAIVWSLVRSGGEEWIEMLSIAGSMLICIPVGLQFLRAARTGRDPYAGKTIDNRPTF